MAKPACWKHLYARPWSGVSQLQIGRVIRHEQEAFVLRAITGRRARTAVATKEQTGRQQSPHRRQTGIGRGTGALMPMQLITPEGFTLLNGGPKYRKAFLDWGCFHNGPDFHRTGCLGDCSSSVRRCAVTRYEQLRPWDKELIRWRSKSARRAGYSAGIAAMAIPVSNFSLSFL